ncbi:hypothetical protein SCHIN_v1c01970 [Spiroplasma chinense]|uniref:Uncharacterized protein n=1 Tax=Spiroplasma chinense TaxID=216932 RepID=A0A5B9Y3M4_9MOLU|nr:hypothetical protein [Spiroplasma chinense]QEH61395.1 hypothetical protein SCHIN_v1c01970 [Spiroplasma chinense]
MTKKRIKIGNVYLDFFELDIDLVIELLKTRNDPEIDHEYDKVLLNEKFTPEKSEGTKKDMKKEVKKLDQFLVEGIPTKCLPFIMEQLEASEYRWNKKLEQLSAEHKQEIYEINEKHTLELERQRNDFNSKFEKQQNVIDNQQLELKELKEIVSKLVQ